MKASPAIPFWNSLLLPLLCLSYATLGGTTMTLTLATLQGHAISPVLERLEHWLLAFNAAMLAIYVIRMSATQRPAARETACLLVRGRYRKAFFGLVLMIGLVATLGLSLAQRQSEVRWLALMVAGCELTGDFALVMVLLKSGLYSPQIAPEYLHLIRNCRLRA